VQFHVSGFSSQPLQHQVSVAVFESTLAAEVLSGDVGALDFEMQSETSVSMSLTVAGRK
jgi:hypothetical protein